MSRFLPATRFCHFQSKLVNGYTKLQKSNRDLLNVSFQVIVRSVGGNRFFIPFSYMSLLETSFAIWRADFVISCFYTETITHPLYFPWLGTRVPEEGDCTPYRLWPVAEWRFCSKPFPFLQVQKVSEQFFALYSSAARTMWKWTLICIECVAFSKMFGNSSPNFI